MSSRLFQEVREKRGLCYAIHAFHMPFADTGLFALYAGTDESDAPELMRVVIDQIGNATETLNDTEINRAKAQMKAGLLMALESLRRASANWPARCSRMGAQFRSMKSLPRSTLSPSTAHAQLVVLSSAAQNLQLPHSGQAAALQAPLQSLKVCLRRAA